MIRQERKQSISEATPSDNPSPTPWPSQPVSGQDEWTKTEIYHSKTYGYSITYPALYTYLDHLDNKAPENIYLLYRADNSGRIFIGVEPTAYLSVDEWLDAANEPLNKYNKVSQHFILEKRIKVTGHDAIMVYSASPYESYPFNKSIIFIKDDNLFMINLHPSDVD
ncbi:MAG: hypothetical protein Q8R40_01055 [bacterium]|nr:hypothetical protein [bacterium]